MLVLVFRCICEGSGSIFVVNHSNAVPHESCNRTQTSGNANSTEVSRSWNPFHCRAPKRQEPLGSLWRLPSPAWVLQPELHITTLLFRDKQSATSDCLDFTTGRSLTTIPTGYFIVLPFILFWPKATHSHPYPSIRKWTWKIPDAHCHWHPMISFICIPCLKGELSQKGVSYCSCIAKKALESWNMLHICTASRSFWTQGSVNTYACSLFRNRKYSTKQYKTCNTTKCQTWTSLNIETHRNGVFLTQQSKHPSWGACGTSYQFRSTKSKKQKTQAVGVTTHFRKRYCQ